MRDMQTQLEGADVRLVSVSVDPERDDPETLAEYAEGLGADTERWWFLTGEKDQIRALARSLQVAADPDPTPEAELGFQVSHSTKFIVLDGEGRVRGYYDGTSEDGRAGAVARARYLAE
jgi:cytochrome oxidase Cu insertion factor (SCO1/SenC/PrrC family)